MKKIPLLLASLLFAIDASAASLSFNFVHGGYTDGVATVAATGSFTGDDLNLDGVIDLSELSALAMTIPDPRGGSFDFDLTDMQQFGYVLGSGLFDGDQRSGWNIPGNSFWSVGGLIGFQCSGLLCGGFQSDFDPGTLTWLVDLNSFEPGIVTAVPLPAGAWLFVSALGILGQKKRKR